MGLIRWYKRDPNAALTGMAHLTLEERGAYNTVLDLIYAHDGTVDDDDRYIAGWLRSDVRVWRRIRQRLLALEKLYLNGSVLRNARADREVDEAIHRVASAAQAGLTSAAKRVERRNVLNGLPSTAVQRPFQLSTSTKKKITSTESVAARGDREELAQEEAARDKRPCDLSRADLDALAQRRREKPPVTTTSHSPAAPTVVPVVPFVDHKRNTAS